MRTERLQRLTDSLLNNGFIKEMAAVFDIMAVSSLALYMEHVRGKRDWEESR